jgi:hypothetical protein
VGPHGFDDLAGGGQDAHPPQRTAIDHRLTIHQDFELSIAAVDFFDLGPQLATDPRRHTDGVQAGDSERTVTNRDLRHVDLLMR